MYISSFINWFNHLRLGGGGGAESMLCYDRWSVSQSGLVSGTCLGPRSDFCYLQTIVGLLKCGSLSDERTGL
jgi:hypothetical protein